MDEKSRIFKERYHKRNTLNLTLIEMCWGMGMAFFAIDAITNVFLGKMHASNTVLGIVPACWALGSLLPFWTEYFTQHFKRKKALVVVLHYLPATFVLLCGIFVYFGAHFFYKPEGPQTALIWATVVLMGLYWICMGLLMPIYVNFIQKVLDTSKRGLAFGSIFAAQCTFGALGTYLASNVLTAAEDMQSGIVMFEKYGLCFIIGAGFILFGNFFFFPIKELEEEEEVEKRAGFRKYVATFVTIFREERSLRNYTLARYFILAYVVFLYMYPSYIEKHFGLKSENIALFAFFSFMGQALGYFTCGLISTILDYKRIAVLGSLVLVGAVFLFFHSVSECCISRLFYFYIVALLLGCFIGIERYYNVNLVMEICRKENKTKYLVLALLLQAPAMAGAVLAGGFLTDMLPVWVGVSHRDSFLYVISGCMIFMVIGTVILQLLVNVKNSKNCIETDKEEPS